MLSEPKCCLFNTKEIVYKEVHEMLNIIQPKLYEYKNRMKQVFDGSVCVCVCVCVCV